MKKIILPVLLLMTALSTGAQEKPAPAPAQPAVAAPAAQPADPQTKEQIVPQFKKEQLEQIVAPIALYTDSLLAQVLAASTYPVDVVEAARWIKRNPSLDQDGINAELKLKSWDTSVKGLVFLPDILAKMNDNLDWTKDLGDAFLTQQADLMDALQIMRGKAKEAGTLKTDANQTVTTTPEGQTEIQPTNPETVYVQNYVPSESYGSNWGYSDCEYPNVIIAPSWPSGVYPPYGWALGYAMGWGNRAVLYNNNYYNGNFYRNNLRNENLNAAKANKNWTHDAAHARQVTPNTRQTAKQLETGRTAQNFQGGNSPAAKELRQDVPQGDRTQAAAKALQTSSKTQGLEDRAQVANQKLNTSNKLQNNAQNIENRAQVANQKINTSNVAQNNAQNIENRKQTINQNIHTGNTALKGSGNANMERAYSNRGAQSRSVSSSKAVRSSGASRSGGGSRGGGGARGGGGGGRR